MSVKKTYTCDYCNPEGDTTVEDNDDGQKAVTSVPNEKETPLGWWQVPGKARDGGTGHACPTCITHREDVRDDIAERRDAETRRLIA